MAHCDFEGRFLRVNQKYCDIVGYSREELLGRTFKDLTHPDDLRASLEKFGPLVRGESLSYTEEKRLVRKDGSPVWISIFVSLQRDPWGEPAHSIGVIQDISDRKRLQTELQQANDRLELAVRGSNIGIWDLHLTDGTFEGGHLHPLNLWEPFGLKADTELDSESRLSLWHPDDRDRVMRTVNAYLRGETQDFEAEYRIRHRDGTYRWRLNRGMAVRDASGRPTRFIGTSVDISERKRAEEALRESEERFRTFVDHATDAFFLHDEDGRILDVNRQACQSLGYKRDELLGMKPFDFDPDITAANLEEKVRKLTSGETIAFESRHRRKDGTAFPVEVRGKVFAEGDRRFTVSLVRDISARKQDEALLDGQKRILELIIKGEPLADVLAGLCRLIEELSQGEMLASLLLLDADGVHLRHWAAPSLPESYIRAIDGAAIGPSAGSCGTAAYRREPVYVSDIASDPLWAPYSELALSQRLPPCWSSPILSSTATVLGTFAVYYQQPSSHPARPAPWTSSRGGDRHRAESRRTTLRKAKSGSATTLSCR